MTEQLYCVCPWVENVFSTQKNILFNIWLASSVHLRCLCWCYTSFFLLYCHQLLTSKIPWNWKNVRPVACTDNFCAAGGEKLHRTPRTQTQGFVETIRRERRFSRLFCKPALVCLSFTTYLISLNTPSSQPRSMQPSARYWIDTRIRVAWSPLTATTVLTDDRLAVHHTWRERKQSQQWGGGPDGTISRTQLRSSQINSNTIHL